MTGPQLENATGPDLFRPVTPGSNGAGAALADGVTAAPGRRLRVLALTKVFPNPVQPLAAAFNRQQFGCLARRADVQVVVPVQWFPGAERMGARTEAGKLARVPDFDWVDGLFVRYPRIFHLPRIDYPVAAGLYFASLLPLFRRLARQADVILGSFVYPDGVAAVWLGRLLGIPSVLYALGSDVNVAAKIPGVPAQLRWTLPQARRIVAVSRDLADRTIALGARPDQLVVIPNGVDRSIFHPRDREQARRELGLPVDGRLILFVGRLEKAKGLEELISAFTILAVEDASLKLVVVGDGAMRARCDQAAAQLGGRMLVAGGRPLAEVSRWMAAADLLALPSWHEGTPNVVLEALASGRPVVASRTGGIPDLVNSAPLGELHAPRDAGALTAALRKVLSDRHDPDAIASRGTVSWQESADQLHDILRAAAAG